VEPAKVKKIEDYVTWLTKQAEIEAGKGNDNEAIQHYIKAADILLALASKTSDQNAWERYTKQAEALQAKAKQRVTANQKSGQPTAPAEKIALPPVQSRAEEPKIPAIQGEGKPGRISRIFGALGGAAPRPKGESEDSQEKQIFPDPCCCTPAASFGENDRSKCPTASGSRARHFH
jgi:hypothetical protein